NIKWFFRINSRSGRTCQISYGVATGFPGGDSHFFQFGPYFRSIFKLHKVNLYILPGSQVKVMSRIAIGYICYPDQFGRIKLTKMKFDTNHLYLLLSLSIFTSGETERPELLFV